MTDWTNTNFTKVNVVKFLLETLFWTFFPYINHIIYNQTETKTKTSGIPSGRSINIFCEIKVTISINRQSTTFSEVLLFQWNLPLTWAWQSLLCLMNLKIIFPLCNMHEYICPIYVNIIAWLCLHWGQAVHRISANVLLWALRGDMNKF